MVLSRSGWVLAALAVTSVCLVAPGTRAAVTAASGPDFPQALLAIASLAQLLVASWVLVVIALAQLAVTSRLVLAVSPLAMRRALFVGAAGALAMSPAQSDRGTSPTRATAQPHSLDGLRLPDRPASTSPTVSPVVVRPGDTLWAIAASSLEPGASHADIAEACTRWHSTNRAVIGDDPNLIHPSQRLNPPQPTKDAA